MESARKMMEKYGWKDGDGLGKNNDGMVKPLKASMKFDCAGLGVDKAKEFNNHWWDRVFNEAANNIQVANDAEETTMAVKDENLVEITTKEYSTQKLQNQKHNDTYSNFLKHSTLTSHGSEVENTNKINVDEIKFPEFKTLTDDELFAACGKRTAHKGARHGLYMSAKLARLAKQDAELLSKMVSDTKDTDKGTKMDIDENELTTDWVTVKTKKKKKSKTDKKPNNKSEEETEKIDDSLFNAEYWSKSSKKMKKKSKTDRELSTSLSEISMQDKYTNSEKSKVDNVQSNADTQTTVMHTKIDSQSNGLDDIQDMPKKNKKSKHRRKTIEKSKKVEKKKAKKLRKTIEKITVNLQNSIIENNE